MENNGFKKSITKIINIIKENHRGKYIEECMSKFENILNSSLQGITSSYIEDKNRLIHKNITEQGEKEKKYQSWYNNYNRILKKNLDYLCKS